MVQDVVEQASGLARGRRNRATIGSTGANRAGGVKAGDARRARDSGPGLPFKSAVPVLHRGWLGDVVDGGRWDGMGLEGEVRWK